jgi:hypothetical protein
MTSQESPESPKFALLKVYVNGEGEVVHVVDAAGNKLKDDNYGENELAAHKTLDKAFLVTENYCRWRLFGDRWVCIPLR